MRDRSIGWVIFGFLLACYLITYTGIIQSSDGLAMFSTAESIARRGDADMNQLLWMGAQQGNIGPDGNLYGRKGLGMTVLALPLVWGALLWSRLGLVHTALLLNPILTALTGALLYRAGIRLGWRRATATAGALGFGLATMAWPYTQTFFSDPVSALGLFGAFYGLLAFSQTGRKHYLVGGATAWGIAYLARTVNLATLPILLLGLWVVLQIRVRAGQGAHARAVSAEKMPLAGWRAVFAYQWRPMVSFLLPIVAAGLISLWWNALRYGSIWESGYVSTETFSAPWLAGIYGLTIGPARGLLWYNPILLLALPGAVWFWRHARKSLYLIAALTAVYILLYAKWYMWHGGYSWGPRFLAPLLPFLALLAVPAWERLVLRRRWGWPGALAASLLALVSIGVQWYGMVIPFGLVQDYLAATVQPLFAPETFTQLRYAPLLLQARFILPVHIHFNWWLPGRDGLGAVDWFALLIPLAGVVVGMIVLRRQTHWRVDAPVPAESDAGASAVDAPRNYLYFVGLVAITLALLSYNGQKMHTGEIAALAARIAAGEQRSRDAILQLVPTDTQDFANAYHGRLATFGLPAAVAPELVDATLAQIEARGAARLWVLPDATPPQASAWEETLRRDHYLLTETRPTGADGRRLALYALAGAHPLAETGMGTLFGSPDPAAQPVTEQNGWFRLAGYGLTQETEPGGEIVLALQWESLQTVDSDFQVFVHLLDQAGDKMMQRDGQPVQWMRPTSSWQPGERIIDRYGFNLPADLPPGAYTVVVGLYDPVTGQRLPVSAGPGDFAIQLGPVVVRAAGR